jgi:hypothetical protein
MRYTIKYVPTFHQEADPPRFKHEWSSGTAAFLYVLLELNKIRPGIPVCLIYRPLRQDLEDGKITPQHAQESSYVYFSELDRLGQDHPDIQRAISRQHHDVPAGWAEVIQWTDKTEELGGFCPAGIDVLIYEEVENA